MKVLYSFLFICLFNIISTNAISQRKITPAKGYSPHIGVMVSMLNDLKGRVISSVSNLNQKETDFLFDDDANRIGALILHLAATEAYYQVYTFEGRGFNDAESDKWNTALNLGSSARKKFINKPIDYYLDIWKEVRAKTLELLKTKDDTWFNAQVDMGSMNNHWAWYHVMEHQGNHMGQIRFLIKRID